jgi:phosphoadenosine phosphosulfate reductase
VKVNPLVLWSDADVTAFEAAQHLPRNPLTQRGYTSIGCAPCTSRPVDADPRSGRWPASTRTECGLHREFLARTV